MPSTYSTSLKIELIGNGEQTGTWGQTTNNNLGTLIEQAIAGVGQISLVGDTVLTNYNGLPDESRNAVLVFSGALAAPANVVAPSVEKTYIITNNSGANVTIKTATGNGVTVQNGLNSLVYCDGTNFYTAVNVNNIVGDLSVSGNETLAGSLTIGGNITLANTVTAGNLAMTANSGIITMAGNVGAFLPPTGTTAERPATPALGMSRWNTTLGQYEIWNGINWQNIASGSYNASYLIVGGGGGGGAYGGGGAGGLLSGITTVSPTVSYTITVGSGGGSATNGQNSSALSFTAIGGGRGDSGNGGSGGGTTNTTGAGTGTTGQGNAGGTGPGESAVSGGGGGAGAVGANGILPNGGNGGAGVASSISGSSVYYAGGGGGNTGASSPTSQAQGGAGGGGLGNVQFGSPAGGTAGSANTGGGGGGGNGGYAGGSGIVILSYQNTTQRATGGTVTSYSTGGNLYWVHTFTSSGTFVA
jgi:hypothetical protein